MPSIFQGTPKPAPVKAPAVMPAPDDDAIKAAKKARLAAAVQQSGRSSTIYTKNTSASDTLG